MSDDFDSRLLDLIYGELTPEDAQAVEAELSQDAAAKRTVDGWHRVREAVKDLPVPEPDPQVHYTILRAAREAVSPGKPKGLWAWLSGVGLNPAFAGVAVMALAVGSVVFFQLNEDTPASALDKAADTSAFAANAPTKGEPGLDARAKQQTDPKTETRPQTAREAGIKLDAGDKPPAKSKLEEASKQKADTKLPSSDGRRSASANNRASAAALPGPAEANDAPIAVDKADDEDALRVGEAEASKDSARRAFGGRRSGGKSGPAKDRQIADRQIDGGRAKAATARFETDRRAEAERRAEADVDAKAYRASPKTRKSVKGRSGAKRADAKTRTKASPARATWAKKKRRSAPRRAATSRHVAGRHVASLGGAGDDAPGLTAHDVDRTPAVPVVEETKSLSARRARVAKPAPQAVRPNAQPTEPALTKAKVPVAEPDASASLKEQAAQFAPPPPTDAEGGDARDGAARTRGTIAGEDSIKRADDRNADGIGLGQIGEPLYEREEKDRVADDVTDLSIASITPRAAAVTGDLADARADDDFALPPKNAREAARGLDVAEAAPVAAKAAVPPIIGTEPAPRTPSFDSGAPKSIGDGLSVRGGAAPQAAPAPIQVTATQPESVRITSGSAAGAGRAPQGEDSATVPLLRAARAARSQGDHRAAVSAYARYFQRHPRDRQFGRGLFEAAASHEALGQVEQAIRMYGLIPSNDEQLYARARARIGALRAARGASAVEAPTEVEEAADRDVVDPMPLPPDVDPPR